MKRNKLLFLVLCVLLIGPITALADDDDRATGGGSSEVMVTLHYCDDENTTVTFNAGYMENIPKSPTKPNYRFTGWYTDKDGGIEVSEYFNRTYDVPKDWYAHWTNVSSFTYTIPADVKIDSKTNKGTINFSGTLDKMKTLKVSITSQNNNKLVNGDQSISYSMDKSSFSYQSESKSKTVNETVNILVNGGGIVAGSYSDKLTFNVSVEQIVTLKNGDVIDIEGKQYTVIEQVEGNQYKVLANELANSGLSKRFDASSNNYANSEIATYLDIDYFNTLPELIKNAIVETAIQRKISSTGYDNGKNSPTWKGETKDAGTHNVFLPSWEELIKVAGDTTPTTLKTFLNSKSVWLRDTCGGHVLIVNFKGFLGNYRPDSNYFVRPAFVLDLSKVSFTKVESGSSDEVTDDTEVIAPVMVENIETKTDEPNIVEENKDIIVEETDKPKDNETTEETDAVEEPTISEPVINEGTETTDETDVATEPNIEEETE